MSSVATLALESESAEGQSQIIDDDQYALDGDLLRAHPVAYGLATEVHIGGGLEDDELSILHSSHSYVAVALRLEAHSEALC